MIVILTCINKSIANDILFNKELKEIDISEKLSFQLKLRNLKTYSSSVIIIFKKISLQLVMIKNIIYNQINFLF